tara:strand:+ start:668 stop:1201 length:534 start_codon:yes stop_codon:yes gene_type:complete
MNKDDDLKNGVSVGLKNQRSISEAQTSAEANADRRTRTLIKCATACTITAVIVLTVLGTSVFHWYFGYPISGASKHSVQELHQVIDQLNGKIKKQDLRYNEREAHQRNKLRFMFGCFFDCETNLKTVDLNQLPENWFPFYEPVIARLKETNSTNALQYFHGSPAEAIAATGIKKEDQ